MWQALKRTAFRLLDAARRSLRRPRRFPTTRREPPAPAVVYGPLRRLLLTDGVAHTLFEEYAAHRSASRGDEETGWVLLGLRTADEALVLATLPAGAEADASAAHVRFNSEAQALAYRVVRQKERRLTIVGVVHTHPGSLRHPSDGDYSGDSEWVAGLRGGEGVFGIGTSDGPEGSPPLFAHQPRPNVQCLGDLRFSWYALARGESDYRPMPVELTIGPDLARPLHPLWPTLEAHARRIDRLYRQVAGVRFEAMNDERGPGLVLTLPLAAGGEALCVIVRRKEVRYCLLRDGELTAVGVNDDFVDRGVYQLLAELAGRECG
jgi:proteasome lid subunit RPN8/RPN11